MFDFKPYAFVEDDDVTKATGFTVDLINVLMSEINFTCVFVKPTDGTFGQLNKDNGQFNGVVGMLQRKELDISALTIRYVISIDWKIERNFVVSFEKDKTFYEI